jgi:hypothetical protein
MRKQNFEEFLQDYHYINNPQLLDDDLPDAFDDWLVELQADDWIKLAEKWQDRQEAKENIDDKIRQEAFDNMFDNALEDLNEKTKIR